MKLIGQIAKFRAKEVAGREKAKAAKPISEVTTSSAWVAFSRPQLARYLPFRYTFPVLRAAVLLSILLAGMSAQTSNPFANDPKAADAGQVVFHIRCAECHGKHGQGGRGGPDLTRGTFINGDQDSDVFRVISNGVSGAEMPAFGERLTSENIWQIVAFLRSAPKSNEKIDGDSNRGEALFWGKGACGNCHTVGRRGNLIGPDLTLVGRQRSLAHLRASLVAPDQDIVPGYESVTVVTRDGKTLRGIQKARDDFSVQFMDLQGRFYSFERGEVQSIKSDARSLMPDYGKTFSTAELNDMLAYLLSLRGVQVTR